jgi:hypothetical protein
MSRPRATEQLHVRIPPTEKQELQAEARDGHGISMSALIWTKVTAATAARFSTSGLAPRAP